MRVLTFMTKEILHLCTNQVLVGMHDIDLISAFLLHTHFSLAQKGHKLRTWCIHFSAASDFKLYFMFVFSTLK